MTSELVWVLIRQDEGGGTYRVGRFATRAEAEEVAGSLGSGADGSGEDQVYVIERVSGRTAGP